MASMPPPGRAPRAARASRKPSVPARPRPPVGRQPRRRHASLPFTDSAVAHQVLTEIGRLIGRVAVVPYARVRTVHVFVLRGDRGIGLLAERDEHRPDEPGVYQTTASVYLPERAGEPGRVLELETHSWDAQTYAADSGDRSWLDVPKPKVYAERDRRTAEVAARLDRLAGFELPAGGTPALNAGLTPDEVARLMAHGQDAS